MPKIKLHGYSEDAQDIQILNLLYDIVEIHQHENLDDIFLNSQFDIPVVSFQVFLNNKDGILNYLSASPRNRLVLLHLLEGIHTTFFSDLGLDQYLETQQVSIITSSDSDYYNSVNIDNFLSLVGENKVNWAVSANHFENVFDKSLKTHNFLFLNKVNRSHRKQLIDWFKTQGLLEHALWSDISAGITIADNHAVDFFTPDGRKQIIDLIGHEPSWPDGWLFPDLYTKTYFSIVTETFFEHPNIFITEKTYKPMMMGHPFIIASSAGFYQKLNDRGYKTFDGLIDESFDKIRDNDKRLLAIADAVADLVNSDLDLFLKNARPICEHNREHFFKEFGLYPLTTYNKLATFIKNICPN
jgi:hypothetical protein